MSECKDDCGDHDDDDDGDDDRSPSWRQRWERRSWHRREEEGKHVASAVILLPVIVVMLTLMKMVICSPYMPFMLVNGDGGDYNGDGDLLTMYAKAIPTPYAIVTEFRNVPLCQKNHNQQKLDCC